MSSHNLKLLFLMSLSLIVSACGGAGDSTSTPGNGSVITGNLLTSRIPADFNHFGSAVAFSPDGLIMAVGERGRTVDNNQLNSGIVQLFTKSGSDWLISDELSATTIAARSEFGSNLAFSPDGEALAIGIPGNISVTLEGSVQLFIKSGSSWIPGPVIQSQTAKLNNEFGVSFAFSPDSNRIAIFERYPQDGINNVQVFTKTGISWNSQPTAEQTLLSKTPSTSSLFGYSLVFSSDSKTLAVDDQLGSPFAKTGAVQLFNLSNGVWSFGPLISNVNNTDSFGVTIAFTPDNLTLAIGEPDADVNTISAAGNIQLFNRSGSDWTTAPTIGPILISTNPATIRSFGSNIVINTDGTKMAILDYDDDPFAGVGTGTFVHIFSFSNSTWLSNQILTSTSATFGIGIAYSIDGTLAVGDSYAADGDFQESGNVTLFN